MVKLSNVARKNCNHHFTSSSSVEIEGHTILERFWIKSQLVSNQCKGDTPATPHIRSLARKQAKKIIGHFFIGQAGKMVFKKFAINRLIHSEHGQMVLNKTQMLKPNPYTTMIKVFLIFFLNFIT